MLCIHYENFFCDTVEQTNDEDPEGDEGHVDGREELVFHIEVEQDQPEGDRQEWKWVSYLASRICLLIQ